MKIKIFLFHGGIMALFLTCICFLQAQVGPDVKARFFKLPYYENNKTKALLTGKEARQVPGGEIAVSEFRMETYRDGDVNRRELVAEAPECFINRTNYIAYSSGPLKMVTANEQFIISGE